MRDLWALMLRNKAWWIVPTILVALLLLALALLSRPDETSPFFYGDR